MGKGGRRGKGGGGACRTQKQLSVHEAVSVTYQQLRIILETQIPAYTHAVLS